MKKFFCSSKFYKLLALIVLAVLFCQILLNFEQVNAAPDGVFRYVGLTSAGSANGTDWANRWAYDSVPWSTVTTLAATQPVFVFLDGGSTNVEYHYAMSVGGSGSSEVNRIYIMPGYAAQQLAVPGDHTNHTGQVIWDLQGNARDGISLNNQSYITVDGYTDPRPSGANTSKFIIRNSNGANNLIRAYNTHHITIRNMQLYKTVNTYAGDAINMGKAQPAIDGYQIIEYNYIHDAGYYNGSTFYAGTWIDGYNNTIVRYNEYRDWGLGGNGNAGEAVGFYIGHQTGGQVYNNIFDHVGTATRSVGKVRFNTFYNTEFAYYANNTLGEDIYLENNIFYLWNSNSIRTAGTDNTYINHNVFYGAVNEAGAIIKGTTLNTLAELNSTGLATIQSNNLLAASNYLVAPASHNFKLTTNATNAKNNAFTTNWAPTIDFISTPVPQDSVADVGAYELIDTSYPRTYFVDATNGNDFKAGISESLAWKTISKVNGMTFNPGDQILFKKGETWLSTTLIMPSSGTEDNNIVVGSYGIGNSPIINANLATNRGINTNGKNYITIQDLEVKNATVFGVFINGGSNIVLSNVISHDNKYEGIRLAATDVTITGGKTYDNGGTANNTGIWLSGDVSGATLDGVEIYDSGSDKQIHGIWTYEALGSGFITIKDCYVHDHSSWGADLMSLNGYKVRNNYFKNNGWGVTHTSGGFTWREGNLKIHDGGNNSIIEKNKFEGGYGWGIDSYLVTGGIYRYNLFINNFDRNASPVGPGIGLEINSSLGSLVYNNTFYGNTIGTQVTYEVGQGVETSITLTNNLYFNNSTENYFKYPSNHGTLNATTNLTDIDPLFVDPSQGDFQLLTLSSAINAGTDVSLTSDYVGTVVPQGGTPDIGAYEYISNSIPTTTDSGIDANWHNSDVTVTLSCSVIPGNCVHTYYTTDGTNPTSSSTEGTSILLSAAGTYPIKYYSVDNYGNSESVKTATNQVKIDKTAPTGSIVINTGNNTTTSTNATLALTSSDANSGNYQMEISENSGFTGASWQTFAASKGFTLSSAEGLKTVYARFKDNAGNISIIYSDTITYTSVETNASSEETSETTPEEELVSFSLKIVDENRNPLQGVILTLHSIVITKVTGRDGIARFTDVERGLHDLTIEYKNVVSQTQVSVDKTITLTMPLEIKINTNPTSYPASYTTENASTTNDLSIWFIIGLAIVLGGGVIFFVNRSRKNKSSF